MATECHSPGARERAPHLVPEARGRSDKELEGFLYQRFPPEMRVAVNAWLGTDPFKNPQARPHPLRMPEYVLSEQLEAARQDKAAGEKAAAAEEANETSDTCVLLTVMFASVLFLGGIASTLASPRLGWAMGSMALTLFMAAMVVLARMPICRA